MVIIKKRIEEILNWIDEKNKNLHVKIKKVPLEETNWFLDNSGTIRNKNGSFFEIKGVKEYNEEGKVLKEQPILIQKEIGYLGLIAKEINGVIHFLMQAKIEPGNVNKIQISPTVQATKSNFKRKHGGGSVKYIEYFTRKENKIIVDQIQSEQSSRFLGKRNRNTIILVEDNIEVLDSHMWMTLEEIKELMKIKNLVNMDTRTVLSTIPYLDSNLDFIKKLGYPKNKYFLKSLKSKEDNFKNIYKYINDYKMFCENKIELCKLSDLKTWHFSNNEFICEKPYPFKVIFCQIEIDKREVSKWTQPLFQATKKGVFGLIIYKDNGLYKFIVKARGEIGCFDKIELSPSVQVDGSLDKYDEIETLFFEKLKNKNNIIYENILSEEGGRFYEEENYNYIIEVSKKEISKLPSGYFSLTLRELYNLIKFNNVLNIQLRNLLSVLEA